MSKIDLFNKKWIDVVFEDKNKSYGAYQLRQQNSWNTTKSLLLAGSVFVFLFFVPKIYSMIKGMAPQEAEETVTEVIMQPPPPINPEVKTPPPVEPPPPKQDQVKFPPPIVKPDNEVRDEKPPTVEDLKKADPGQKTMEGDPTADVVAIGPVGEGPKQAVVVEDNTVYSFVSMENPPAYPGGIEKFYKFLGDNIKYPPMAAENNIQGNVFVSFTVEKDGALTDIKIDRKLGYGTDEEAVRVLKLSKRWNPGMQNGKPVRVKYNIPIKFSLQQ
ncbi:energy transducer TonB [Pedobacter sp. UBA4863]|uniref:energy transducer TonB n=1 Tax=Pedobacter sp. UBA4863 TaxID=1947060 RepID=UPI0025D78DA8|nr:energy transducer TonB [Pedobacter sp. UBA4863]